MAHELAALEAAVLTHAPPGAVVGGSAISPDGRYAATLTILPSASEHPMDGLFEWTDDGWTDAGGGSAGVSWTSLDSVGDSGVLRYADEAPSGATTAVIFYEGREYRAPVREGWFFIVVWDTKYTEEPRLLRFD